MLKTLRLQVSIRFFSLFPVGVARDLLKLAKSQLERSKKEEAIWRSQKRQVDDHTISNTGFSSRTLSIFFLTAKQISSISLFLTHTLLLCN